MRAFLTGYEATGDYAMRATKVAQKCLGDALPPMHGLRRRVLLRAVEALTHGRRPILLAVRGHWCRPDGRPGAQHDAGLSMTSRLDFLRALFGRWNEGRHSAMQLLQGSATCDSVANCWERGRQKLKGLRLRAFGQLFRSFSSDSYGYLPQTIEKPDPKSTLPRSLGFYRPRS